MDRLDLDATYEEGKVFLRLDVCWVVLDARGAVVVVWR